MEKAKKLYTEDGLSPMEIVDRLRLGTDLYDAETPEHRSTVNRWAMQYGWSPHWKEARKKQQYAKQDGDPFISGITDPISHLAKVKALNQVSELIAQYPDATNSQIQQAVLTHINFELSPGPRVIRELNPLIKKAIGQARKTPRLTEQQRLQAIMSVKLAPGEEYVHAVQGSTQVGAVGRIDVTGVRGPARRSNG
jgi:hypothetical protein